MRFRRAFAFAAVVIALSASACAEEKTEPGQGNDEGGQLIVQSASYDVSVGPDERVILGLLTPDQLFVSYGAVDVEFFYLGTKKGEGKAQQGPTATGEFLPVPGEGAEEPASVPDEPIVAPASRGRGVYETHVELDRAGYWSAQVTAETKDGTLTGNTVFEVHEEPVYPAAGQPAPKTDNLTIDSKDAPITAVDSAASNGKVPDPELHQMTIADSIARKEPAVVVFSTPVYCVSRFCGPITDTIASLEKTYRDRANFLHIEVWRNFEKQVVNKGAADWIYKGGDLTEPWVYFIGSNGKIVERWDNVVTADQIEVLLKKLPRM